MTAEQLQTAKVLCLGASDSSGGAGLLADARQLQMLEVEPVWVQLAASAQNSQGVQALELLSLELIEAQWQAAAEDGLPAVLRLGWLPARAEYLDWLLSKLKDYSGIVLWDPVLKASFGEALTQNWAPLAAQLKALLARVDLLSPNLYEARTLLSWLVPSKGAELAEMSAEHCAKQLIAQGAGHVLITGGDTVRAGGFEPWLDSFFAASPKVMFNQGQLPGTELVSEFYLRQVRLSQRVHGSGCHLLSALAGLMALGHNLYDALVLASALARAAMRQAKARPSGYGQAFAQGLNALIAEDYPVVIPLSLSGLCSVQAAIGQDTLMDSTQPLMQLSIKPLAFKPLASELGLYALVEDIEHLKVLLALGIDTLQWRVKVQHPHYEQELIEAIRLCQAAQVPLYINDDWRMAIKHHAFGVHLGQEDLAQADLAAIANAGLALGISTHSPWEIARARALNPSYIALGPIHAPLSKTLRYAPLGYEQVARWCQTFTGTRFTTIGGITRDNIRAVAAIGVGSAAIVTDLKPGADLAERYASLRLGWQSLGGV